MDCKTPIALKVSHDVDNISMVVSLCDHPNEFQDSVKLFVKHSLGETARLCLMKGYAHVETDNKHISYAKLHFLFAHKLELNKEGYIIR